MRFNIPLVNRRRIKFSLNDEFGFCKSLLHIAQFVAKMGTHIALFTRIFAQRLRGLVFQKQRRVLFHGFLDSQNGLQHLVFDIDQIDGFLCRMNISCRNRSHCMAVV